MLQQEIGDLNRGKVHLESELESELFNIKLLQGFEEILLQQEDSLFSLRQGEEDGTFGFTEEIRTVSSVGQIDLERQIALLEAEEAYLAGLKEQVTTFEPPQKQFRKCINCKKDVNVRDENIDEASSPTSSHCVFHPGKLKFFSCKGCGGDEYHTCCNRCDNCNKGCRQQRHVFTRD
ncbi:hypothetical protein FGO68_gene2277 [Halteria grandinella]|uniref:Uncharacterized protein n=1 Tax=Halteria grandinella TaxID=5974 RepID=A0A8J8NBH5_HALGN|nr:hypothetical protein FGO68_gene2277 [Halteria grandinella]